MNIPSTIFCVSEVKLSDINNRLAFLIREEKTKNQPSNGKHSYFVLNNNPDTSRESVSEIDNATPTNSTCPYANDLNSMKEHIQGRRKFFYGEAGGGGWRWKGAEYKCRPPWLVANEKLKRSTG